MTKIKIMTILVLMSIGLTACIFEDGGGRGRGGGGYYHHDYHHQGWHG